MRASKLQQRNVENDGTKEESKKPAAVLGDVKEKPVGEEIEEDTTPQLKDEDDVDDGDRKPAAKATGAPKEETVVVVVTMDEAKYSTDRMIKALKKLGPFLQPEPTRRMKLVNWTVSWKESLL